MCFVFDALFPGMKFQSNLNEIDKFEQKSQADSSSKVYEWPSKDEAHVESKYIKITSKQLTRTNDFFLPNVEISSD